MWEIRKNGVPMLPRLRTASEAHTVIYRDGGDESEYRLFRIEEDEYPVDLKAHGYDPLDERELVEDFHKGTEFWNSLTPQEEGEQDG